MRSDYWQFIGASDIIIINIDKNYPKIFKMINSIGKGNMKIIVIDDEIAALNTFLLGIVDKTDLGYSMFNNNPLASIDYVKHNKVNAAFLDINMPMVSGVDLAEQLIATDEKIKIIFISGYAHDEDKIREKLGENLLGFCYKPYDTEALHILINKVRSELNNEREIFIKTFDSFDVFVDGKAVKFSSGKSKELLALLVDRNGGYLTMDSAITFLWVDKHIANSKRLYRDAVYKLRKDLLNENMNIVEFGRAQLKLNSENIKCDYWDYLKEKTAFYHGSYMPCYDWSMETQSILDNSYNN